MPLCCHAVAPIAVCHGRVLFCCSSALQEMPSIHITMFFPGPTRASSHFEKEFLVSSVSPDVRPGPVPAAQHSALRCCVSQGLLRLASPASNTTPAAPAQLHQCPADTGAAVQQELAAVGSCSSSWLPAETSVSVSHLRSSVLMVGQEGWSPHICTGKLGHNNSGTPDPAALLDSPGAEGFSLDGPRVILSVPCPWATGGKPHIPVQEWKPHWFSSSGREG